MTDTVEEVDPDTQVKHLINVGAAFASVHMASNVFEAGNFDDDDAAALAGLPQGMRLHAVARLMESAEIIREELRLLDGYLLGLTEA